MSDDSDRGWRTWLWWIAFLWLGGAWALAVMQYGYVNIPLTVLIIALAAWYHRRDLRQWGGRVLGKLAG